MQTNRLIVSLFATLFIIVLSFTITGLASPYIVSDLGGDRFITTYAMAFFGFGTAITIPLAKPFASQFNRIFLYLLLLFACTNIFCAIAPTYFLFIVGRLLMGMSTGPLYPLLAHGFSCVVSEKKKIVITWIFVTILVVTPVIGGSWGGTIAYLYTWRAMFYFNGAAAVLLAIILWFNMKEIEISSMKGPFDWIGWTVYAVGVLSLSFVIATAQQLDWYRSPTLMNAALIGVVTFGYFLIRCFHSNAPVMRLRLFAKPIFSLALLSLATLFAVYFGMIVLLSIWLTFDVRFTPLWIAVLLGTMGIAGLFPRFIIEERLGSIDPRILLSLAAALLAISCFYTSNFDININFGRIAISRIIAGFGLAIFLPPIFQILSQCYAPKDWVDIFELFQSVRTLAAALGAAIFTIMWQRRSVFYHERLSEKLNAQSHPVDILLNKIETLHVPGDPLARLNDLLDTRSYSLALNDVFYAMGWILAALFVILLSTFLFKRNAFDIRKAKYTETT